MEFVDIAFTKENGYYDLFIENGDLGKTKGIETSILTSLFTDARASESEQPVARYRRGWWGDAYRQEPTGSKLWLVLNNPLTDLTSNQVISFSYSALDWMISEGYFTDLKTSASVDLATGTLNLSIDSSANNKVTSRVFEIVRETK